jgi:hypothetical protein
MKVYSQGNTLCYRCHMATEYGTRKHHFHDPAKPGASASIKMPERTYMVVDPRRDHSIRVPSPIFPKTGNPHACTCHVDNHNGRPLPGRMVMREAAERSTTGDLLRPQALPRSARGTAPPCK